MSIPTDSAALADPKDPHTNTIYKIHSLFLSKEERAAVEAKYKNGGMGYKEAKDMCIESIDAFIAPMRDKYNSITSDQVREVLEKGKERVRPIIVAQMNRVREAVGITL
jgi:tryptophanyl-tRNA synthetase